MDDAHQLDVIAKWLEDETARDSDSKLLAIIESCTVDGKLDDATAARQIAALYGDPDQNETPF